MFLASIWAWNTPSRCHVSQIFLFETDQGFGPEICWKHQQEATSLEELEIRLRHLVGLSSRSPLYLPSATVGSLKDLREQMASLVVETEFAQLEEPWLKESILRYLLEAAPESAFDWRVEVFRWEIQNLNTTEVADLFRSLKRTPRSSLITDPVLARNSYDLIRLRVLDDSFFQVAIRGTWMRPVLGTPDLPEARWLSVEDCSRHPNQSLGLDWDRIRARRVLWISACPSPIVSWLFIKGQDDLESFARQNPEIPFVALNGSLMKERQKWGADLRKLVALNSLMDKEQVSVVHKAPWPLIEYVQGSRKDLVRWQRGIENSNF